MNGAIGENESASDEIGSSRMLGDIEVPLLRGDTEDDLPMASKAFILDCNNVEGAMAVGKVDDSIWYKSLQLPLARQPAATFKFAPCGHWQPLETWHLPPLLNSISMP